MRLRKLPPVPAGEVLLEEFLKPLGISQYQLAKDISVPPRRINEIVHGKRAVTADTALRLSRYLGTSERFWLNLQSNKTTPKEYTSDFSVNCCRLKYSGSRYPTLPFTTVLTCDWSNVGPVFDNPKSDIFATHFSSRRMLVDFTSRWITVFLAPVWR